MPKRYTTCKLYDLLESTDRKFACLITKDPEISEKYKPIAKLYQGIINKAQQSKTQSTARKLCQFRAQLGYIQCQLNSIDLSPNDTIALQANNTQLKCLKKELNTLVDTTTQFKKELISSKIKLTSDYVTFWQQLSSYQASWKSHCNDVRAAYYYNCADNLETVGAKANSVAIQKEKLTQAISLFEASAAFYEKNGKTKEKSETDCKIAETKVHLARLKQKSPIKLPASQAIIEKTASMTSIASNRVVASSSNTLFPLNKVKQDIEINVEPLSLPFKKRKYQPDEPTEVNLLHTKKLVLEEKIVAEKFQKITSSTQTTPVDNVPHSLLTVLTPFLDYEILLNTKFSELAAASLEKTRQINHYYFLIELFADIATWISLDKPIDKKVFQHNLLTKCYLLDTALQLIDLLQMENNNLLSLDKLKYRIVTIIKTLASRYPSLPISYKSFHLDELKKIRLNIQGLCQFLLSEIKNYMWGLEAITEDNKLQTDLFYNIYRPLTTRITHFAARESIEKVFKHARLLLTKLSSETQTLFYSRFARELVKFYIAAENKNWVESNKIQIEHPSFVKELLNWLSFAKELAFILEDHNFILKINTLHKVISKNIESSNVQVNQPSFFNLSPQKIDGEKIIMQPRKLDPIKVNFYKKLKDHLEHFYYNFNLTLSELTNIYSHLIQFIDKQITDFKSEKEMFAKVTFQYSVH